MEDTFRFWLIRLCFDLILYVVFWIVISNDRRWVEYEVGKDEHVDYFFGVHIFMLVTLVAKEIFLLF